MRIEIEGLVLKTQDGNLVLAEMKEIKAGKNAGEIKDEVIGYYSTLKYALRAIKEHKLKMSDATTLEELLVETKRFNEKVDDLCRRVGL